MRNISAAFLFGTFSTRGSRFEIAVIAIKMKEDKNGEGYGLRRRSSRLITRCQNCQEQEGESNQG